ncbi:hypothetical protein [Aquimarina mytili]|uniref:Uncharacterized protein n=1 Tax=Aquimarina mytili TaxID=874423 RepID=A0A937A0I6_9FLAO|nr:hypothetical protein [Aquimarina mytili]MBL0685761.1 hypothetical protein [Aquimarina mytili]
MEYKTKLFIPRQLIEKKTEILRYYKNEITFEDAKAYIYGGTDLTEITEFISFEIIDIKNLTIRLKLYHHNNTVTTIKKMSFRQLTIESSNNFNQNPKKSWEELTPQERVEICQHELSRWSLILKSEFSNSLEIENGESFDYIELINNCTTSEGFEIKIHSKTIKYHASFEMPPEVYNVLCQEQAGSEARQGWFVDWNGTNPVKPDKNHGLINTSYPNIKTNPAFSQIYWESEYHMRDIIKIDLSKYRTVYETIMHGQIDINFGTIDYNRWTHALGPNNEYIQKPKVRKLIVAHDKTEYIDPPSTYSEILSGTYKFRLPLFLENGIYDVTSPKEKKHYSILQNINMYEINVLNTGKHEIVLYNSSAKAKELQRLVVGNIDLDSIPTYPEIQTIDRFCFAPRKTTSKYDENWLPSSIKEKNNTTYAFLLTDQNNYIQPESWGLERMILSKENNERLIIDLISYERILPIWQGSIKVQNVVT